MLEYNGFRSDLLTGIGGVHLTRKNNRENAERYEKEKATTTVAAWLKQSTKKFATFKCCSVRIQILGISSRSKQQTPQQITDSCFWPDFALWTLYWQSAFGLHHSVSGDVGLHLSLALSDLSLHPTSTCTLNRLHPGLRLPESITGN
jgi:hypothetical protein